jgi:hypothetical protein
MVVGGKDRGQGEAAFGQEALHRRRVARIDRHGLAAGLEHPDVVVLEAGTA